MLRQNVQGKLHGSGAIVQILRLGDTVTQCLEYLGGTATERQRARVNTAVCGPVPLVKDLCGGARGKLAPAASAG